MQPYQPRSSNGLEGRDIYFLRNRPDDASPERSKMVQKSGFSAFSAPNRKKVAVCACSLTPPWT
jgi:hypothetical protein